MTRVPSNGGRSRLGLGRLRVDPRAPRFLVVGASCYGLNLALLAFGVEIVGMRPMPAFVAALAIMTVLGHFLNRVWTFGSRDAYGGELGRFGGALLLQAGSGAIAIWLLVDGLGLHYLAANVLVTVVCTAGSFLVQRAFVFRPADPPR